MQLFLSILLFSVVFLAALRYLSAHKLRQITELKKNF